MPLWLSRITALRATCADHSRSKGSGISCSGTRFNEERKSFTPLSVSFTSGGRSFMSIVYANVRRTCSDASSSFTTLYVPINNLVSTFVADLLHFFHSKWFITIQWNLMSHNVNWHFFFSLKTSCFILCSKNFGKLRWADLDQKDVFISSHGNNSLPVLLNRMQMQFPTATFQLLLLFIFFFFNWECLCQLKEASGMQCLMCQTTHVDNHI